MAEFQEVAKAYVRMCESFEETCEGCSISAGSGNDIYVCRNKVLKNPEKYEDTIMRWAAEHPEPQYPTWGEWLKDNVHSITILRGFPDPDNVYDLILHSVISTDIAEKLGIKPKEAR